MPTDDPVQPISKTDFDSTLEGLVAQSFFGYESEDQLYSQATRDMQANYRVIMSDIIRIFDRPDLIIRNIDQNNLTPNQVYILDQLISGEDPTFAQTFLVEYLNSSQTSILFSDEASANIPNIDEVRGDDRLSDALANFNNVTKKHGYLVMLMLQKYEQYKESGEQAIQDMDPFDWLSNQLKQVGTSFEPNIDFLDVNNRMKQIMLRQMGKFRADTTPASVAPWQCRIGGSTFYVPPVNISVSQMFKTGSFGGAAIRQPNSAKFNSGHSETNIEMTLYFPNHETIWGFVGDKADFNFDPVATNSQDPDAAATATSDSVIDFYISSLRGLVTQFKYSPFLPIKNQYLNQSYDINAVTLLGMSVATLPDYPFCLAVTLQMAKFNHKVYLPMIDDFDQAIHWGKFRQFIGKAAARLDAVVNQGFLVNPVETTTDSNSSGKGYSSAPGAESPMILEDEGDLLPRFDKAADIQDGRYFDLYIPKSTPARIFAPDTTDFRQPGEDAVLTSEKWNGILDMIGIKAVDKPYFQFSEYDTYIKDGRYTSERFILQNWLQLQKLTWERMGSKELNSFVSSELEDATAKGSVTPESKDLYRSQLQMAWFSEIYKSYMNDPVFQKKMEIEKYKDGQYLINEWKIPMEKVSIDWTSCIIQGISVSLSNTIARLQVQMQDEPVHQHIGGGDSMVNVSMIILGEQNLIKLRRVFDHINSLARLEHGHGVLGFLGIKNVVTALCGIKYVMPTSFEVDTIPNYPHAYSVRLSFVDFDIFQQKREKLSSDQQKDLIDAFGKRNPFLRIKQRWGAFNAYPDLPLEVRDEDRNIVGHLDPDWYFRSFTNSDKDIYNWNSNVDLVSKLEAYTYIDKHPPKQDSSDYDYLMAARHQLEVDIRAIVDSGVELPDGYSIDNNGKIVTSGKATVTPKDNTVPLRYYLGTLDKDQENLYYIEMDRAGAIKLGSQDVKSGKDNPSSTPPHTYAEQNASQTLTTASLTGTVPPSQHQHEYWNKSDNPTRQFELMMQDWNYRQIDGRMLRAFPTYMLWLIDEGGRFAGIKLFDNFYGLNSVIDFSVVQSEDSMDDTLILRVSNLFSRLSTPYKDSLISQDDPLLDTPIGRVISTGENRNRNLLSGLTDQLVEINNIRLKPGVRVHLRAGYGANPNNLQTIFNGTITEVEQGDIMTITAQTDTIELSAMVNTTNKKGHSGTIDGGINCFTKDTKLNLWDGGTITIGEIVDGKIYPTLIGRNEEGNLVPSKVLAGHNFGPKDKWMKIKLSNHIDPTIKAHHNTMTVTPGHHIVINGEYSQAGYLKTGDRLTSFERSPSKRVMHFIKSSLLGDGCIVKNGKSAAYKEAHCGQDGYAKSIWYALGDCAGKSEYYVSGYGSQGVIVRSKTYKSLRVIRDEWYIDGVKTLPADLSWVDDFTIAKWYMDDGSLGKRTYGGAANFATNGFTEVEVNRLASILTTMYGVETKVYFSKGWCLTVNKGKTNQIDKMWKAIAPYIHPSLKYKLPEEYRDIEYTPYVFNGKEEILECDSTVLGVEWLKSSRRSQGGGSLRKAYDITTSTGNYFCRGILVHNTGFWLSEPRDLMVRLLSMGSSAFKEWVAWGSQGTIFSENRFGIRHFGSILYEEMTKDEKVASARRYGAIGNKVSNSKPAQPNQNDTKSQFASSLGNLSQDLANIDFGSFSAIYNTNMIAVMEAMWINSFKKRDYELFKRNIYPGNGLGIAQFMAGDMIDAGAIVSSITSTLTKIDSKATSTPSAADVSAAEVAAQNKAIIDASKAGLGMSAEDDTLMINYINSNTFTSPELDLDTPLGGLVSDLRSSSVSFSDVLSFGKSILETTFDVAKYTDPLYWSTQTLGWIASTIIPGATGDAAGWVIKNSNPFAAIESITSVGSRLMNSPLLQAFGVFSPGTDDDLRGYDEVSFRAQTYMKTVWDLFQLCSALLPNYIVAVRPFEDRSTVFYGKPHWLYTSGVVPVSNGVPRVSKPDLELPDSDLEALKRYASQNLSSFEEFQKELADIGALNDKVATSYEGTYTSGFSGAGLTSSAMLDNYPTSWENNAFLAKSEGTTSEEMHLPTVGEQNQLSGGLVAAPTEADIALYHYQLPSLPPNRRYPYYMDHLAGDGAGGKTPNVGADGYIWDWGGGDTIISASSGKSGKTIGNENPNSPGTPGSFGYLEPEEEQWYISSFWPLNNDVCKRDFRKAGFPQETIDKIEQHDLRSKDYKGKRILVWAEKTQRAVVCTPGDWGPHPQDQKLKDHVCGLSPDTIYTLGISQGDRVQLRCMPDDTPLGPLGDSTATVNGVTATLDPNWKDQANSSKGTIGRERDTGKDSDSVTPSSQTTVDPATGDTVVISESGNSSADNWRKSVADQINQKLADLRSQKIGSRAMSQANANEMNSYLKAAALLNSDPIVFAYHFGWKFDGVPSYVDLSSGLGYDLAGDSARKVYDTWGGERPTDQQIDIWEDFRIEFRTEPNTVDIYNRSFPQERDTERFNEIYDMFLRFMWQVPSNRAWLINNANRVADGIGTQTKDVLTLGLNNDGGLRWNWDNVFPVWQSFITSHDIALNESGTPYSPTTAQYMMSNNKGGKNASTFVGTASEDVRGWFDENIGSFISMVGDTITGVLSMIRLSMMQVGVGLNLAGTMQRQANILNSVFNDSIYYQMGTEHSLLRLIDNPFTREYGEPVVEIREPFQRIHFLSSFQHILNNSISENLSGVYTVVTATSDGKYPVTVHFDKGMSPEKQMEKAVDTGLFWDNTVGSGLTGMFQPLIHPIEAMRSLAKDAAGSSDLLSSKRVALWHLKESLKDIYMGELLVLGNTDIRPHDLVYLADVYERMYGMFEVEKVIHHFTPENGFITSVVPNAIVTINDPARWSLIAWAWRKMSEHSIRSDTRAMLAVKADRNASMVSEGLMSDDIPNIYSTQLLGALQYTQGNTALVRDFASMYSMGGMTGLSSADKQTNEVDQIDQNLRLTKAGLTTAGIIGGGLAALANPVAGAGIAVGAYAVGDLLWKAWEWVRDNLFDQHGCYIQYLNKDGQPMDAGLSYFQGVAVGQHHSISMFPSMLGIAGSVNTVENGHYRITSNDLLAALGWSEVETAFVQRETSWFVDQINAEVLKVSGRSPDPIIDTKSIVLIAQVLNPDGEALYEGGGKPLDQMKTGVIDGDTIHVRIIRDVNGNFSTGGYETIRLASVNTPELKYKQYADTGFDETSLNLPNDLALLARNYLKAKFTPISNRVIAIRVNADNKRDAYGRLIGVVFHNLPLTTQLNITPTRRGDLLAEIASREPVVSWDSYLDDGRPYTLNWELVMGGFGNVYLPDAIFNSVDRQSQISDTDPVT